MVIKARRPDSLGLIIGLPKEERKLKMSKRGDGTFAQDGAEDKLLATLTIKCKECDARMSWGRQEGKRYYMCTNNEGHADNLDRFVWVDMPTYLDFN